MHGTNSEDIQKYLHKVMTISKFICYALKTICGVFCLFLVAFLIFSIISQVAPANIPFVFPPTLYETILLVIAGLVVTSIIWIGAQVFSDASKGIPPFAFEQVRRLRSIAVLLLLYMLLEVLLSPAFSSIFHIGDVGVGYAVVSNFSEPTISINFGAILGSAVFWALSFIFEYGITLQKLSDETL